MRSYVFIFIFKYYLNIHHYFHLTLNYLVLSGAKHYKLMWELIGEKFGGKTYNLKIQYK